jgi:hypothetical protein
MARWTRRDFLKGAAATVVVGGASTAIAVDQGLRADRLDLALPDLDPAHDGLRVAQLSDLHVGALTPMDRVREAVATANAFRPDLVALTGDFISDCRCGIGFVREQLVGLAAPAVAVLGNHDHYVAAAAVAQALAGLGYAVLRNQNTTLVLRGAPFTVVGVDDHCTGHADPGRAMAGMAPGSRLVLAHDPTTVDLLDDATGPLLVLSGHTHGGQVNLPLPRFRYMPYKAGLFRVGAVRLYVNRGVGNTWLPFRVNAPPEVTLITMRAAVGEGSGPTPATRDGKDRRGWPRAG